MKILNRKTYLSTNFYSNRASSLIKKNVQFKNGRPVGRTIKLRNLFGYYSKSLYIFLLSATDQISISLLVFKWGHVKVNISSLKQHFTLKFALFGAITRKPFVRKCCEWSQKLLLGPLSTLDKSKVRIFKWGHDKVNISSQKQHFTLKFAIFGAITRKPLVRKCCEWSQKLLLGPLSTLDKSNWPGPFRP